jgi:hypothetical protein
MKNLQELLALNEQKTFEIADIVKSFPSKKEAETHLRKLWGTPKLTYQGNVVLGGNDDVFDGLEKAAEDVKDEMTFEVGNSLEDHNALEIKLSDWQECYLGYDPKTGHLWQGFDCWLDEEDLNQKSEDEGIDYDEDKNSEWGRLWEDFKDARPYVILEMKSDDGKHFTVVDHIVGSGTSHGMFYSAGYNEMKRRGIIDLRLD